MFEVFETLGFDYFAMKELQAKGFTMNDIFSKFDNEFDVEGLAKDAAEVASNNGANDYPVVTPGTYEVKMTECELAASKNGLPMVKARFKITEGKFKNSLLFYNQVIHKGFALNKNNEFFKSMDLGLDIKFTSFQQYGELMMDCAEAAEGLLFALEYVEKNDFPTYKILEVFEA